jgi:hypothetical protein
MSMSIAESWTQVFVHVILKHLHVVLTKGEEGMKKVASPK